MFPVRSVLDHSEFWGRHQEHRCINVRLTGRGFWILQQVRWQLSSGYTRALAISPVYRVFAGLSGAQAGPSSRGVIPLPLVPVTLHSYFKAILTLCSPLERLAHGTPCLSVSSSSSYMATYRSGLVSICFQYIPWGQVFLFFFVCLKSVHSGPAAWRCSVNICWMSKWIDAYVSLLSTCLDLKF